MVECGGRFGRGTCQAERRSSCDRAAPAPCRARCRSLRLPSQAVWPPPRSRVGRSATIALCGRQRYRPPPGRKSRTAGTLRCCGPCLRLVGVSRRPTSRSIGKQRASVGLSGVQPERYAAEVGDVASTSDHDWVALDFETATGRRASACAVGLVYVRQGRIVGTESFLIQPPGNAYSRFNERPDRIAPRMRPAPATQSPALK